jgi:DNA/RNA-binding domain of Phe-tRNA-synthetase-like protein
LSKKGGEVFMRIWKTEKYPPEIFVVVDNEGAVTYTGVSEDVARSLVERDNNKKYACIKICLYLGVKSISFDQTEEDFLPF